MYRLTQSKYQSNLVEEEEGIEGVPNSSSNESIDLEGITSVLDGINEKMDTIIERIDLIESKTDTKELEEQEEQYRNEIKDILNSINEKETVNIDLDDIKVNDPINEEILTEIQDTRMIIVENIDMAKDFASVGFGVLMGIVAGYVILKFMLWR